jgi:hypothetical protein
MEGRTGVGETRQQYSDDSNSEKEAYVLVTDGSSWSRLVDGTMLVNGTRKLELVVICWSELFTTDGRLWLDLDLREIAFSIAISRRMIP